VLSAGITCNIQVEAENTIREEHLPWRANKRIAKHEFSPDCSQVPCTAKSGWEDDEKDGLLAPKITMAKET